MDSCFRTKTVQRKAMRSTSIGSARHTLPEDACWEDGTSRICGHTNIRERPRKVRPQFSFLHSEKFELRYVMNQDEQLYAEVNMS